MFILYRYMHFDLIEDIEYKVCDSHYCTESHDKDFGGNNRNQKSATFVILNLMEDLPPATLGADWSASVTYGYRTSQKY